MISAISMDGSELSIESAAVGELADSLQGQLFLQADHGYAEAKQVWNGMFDDKQPAMVVQCGAVQDVVYAVNFARERRPADIG